MSELLTTGEVARIAGVGATAVKRWWDEGLLVGVKTAGGHRRFRRADVERFLRAGEPDDRRQVWLQRLVHGTRHEVEGGLLLERGRTGSWHAVADALGPVLTELGLGWERGDITIAEEHVASERLLRSLARIGDGMGAAAAGPCCVLACGEQEQHTLGLALAELVVREARWTPLWLGRSTPASEVARVIAEREPEVVGLSASVAARAGSLRSMASAVAAACEAVGAALVLGGSGPWPSGVRGAHRVESFGAFHRLLERLAQARSRANDAAIHEEGT